jgi:hypothetical protein
VSDPGLPAAEGESLDLSSTDPPVSGTLERPIERPYDPEPEREKVRARIALGLTALVSLLALMAFTLRAQGALTIEDLERLQLFFTPLITLSGTALGFYFGGRAGR